MSVQTHRPSDVQLGREAYRRRQTIKSIAIAAASTLVVAVVLIVAITGSPGWQRTRDTFLDYAIGRESLRPILVGLWLNLRLLFFCSIGSLLLGLLIAVLRTLRGPVFFPVRGLATLYTYVFRGMPLIIVL